jgi:hypothetical protein
MDLTAGQAAALGNLARKHAGEEVDFINIADARSLTDLGLAERTRSGWDITRAGLQQIDPAPIGDRTNDGAGSAPSR